LNHPEPQRIAERLVATYRLQISKDVAASIFTNQPKLPILLSRASFRPDVDVRTQQRTRLQRERRHLLHSILGLAVISLSGLMLLKLASLPKSQAQTSGSTSNTPNSIGRLLANASNIPPNQSLTLNDPSFGPIMLIRLDNGQFVAYSSICTHAGCQVQFNPYGKDIACPCHGAVFDPYNNAQVLRGPARYPLRRIPIQYQPSTGNIYVTN